MHADLLVDPNLLPLWPGWIAALPLQRNVVHNQGIWNFRDGSPCCFKNLWGFVN